MIKKIHIRRMEKKEDSENKPCFPFCPYMFESCFERDCFYWYRFY